MTLNSIRLDSSATGNYVEVHDTISAPFRAHCCVMSNINCVINIFTFFNSCIRI